MLTIYEDIKMWKHTHCDGDVYTINNEGDWCSKCNELGLCDGQIYLDHYIINTDGINDSTLLVN